MCGIAGCIVPRGERPRRNALERMAAALRHRGPDDQGIEVVESVGLVSTRLAIIDPGPSGHQPMSGPDGRWIAYNGEIFNHEDLRSALPAGRYAGGSDTETLLHALACWGERAIEQLNGFFAFAALDGRGGRLLLARDRFGVKPLYWARQGGAVWFASEIGALLAAGVPRRANAEVLRHALAVGWAGGSLTPVEGVRRLAPGSMLTIGLADLRVTARRWYEPSGSVDSARGRVLRGISHGEALDAVEAELRASVRRRLMSDVPVGTMCSGGVDSSLVTAFASSDHPGIHAFNASITDQPDANEGPWAERVTTALGVELHTVAMDAASWRRSLVQTVRHVEYPLTHESSVPMAQIAALAREAGVKVLLSGEGADELFGGYPWRHLPHEADFRARRRPLERTARAFYRRLQHLGLAGGHDSDPEPGPLEEINRHERTMVARAERAYAHHRGPRRRLEARLLADLELYLPHLLNRQDKTTMQESVETREPFLDPELVSLSVNLPLEMRVEPRRKELLRGLAERHLPPGVADRPKIGFGFDAARYIEAAARSEFLLDGRLRDVLEAPGPDWTRAVEGASGAGALRLWTGEIWCRALLDGEATEQVESELWTDPDRVAQPA